MFGNGSAHRKGLLDWVEGKQLFSQEETALILEGACLDRLSAETLHKLERLDLAESLDALPRNLCSHHEAKRPSSSEGRQGPDL